MGNLGETKYLAAEHCYISNDNDYLELWVFKNGNCWYSFQAFGRGDYREIVKTLLRNFILAIIIAFLIIVFKPLFI